ncbi:MAG TPA: hypothetical protein VL172_05475, partial [Kofleriaceae bacterium]|nr:hypothetical protein [Kofleriaceae bacterium]
VEAAPLDADGPGEFAPVAGTALASARTGFTEVLTRSQLILGGGAGAGQVALDVVEAAPASGEGALAGFTVAGTVNVKARSGHVGFTAGHRTYVIGGGATDSVEAATLADTGAVSDFTKDSATVRADRSDAGAALARDQVYVAGGRDGVDLASVEQASLARDATLGPFAAAGALTHARARAGWVVLGDRLCAVGGDDDAGSGGALASVECAPIGADGTLGAFADAGVTLNTPRSGPALAVIGSWLYVIGGSSDAATLRGLERAAIAEDGTLGAFAAAGTLQTARTGATAIVLGSTLHVLGGWNGSDLEDTYESAAILAGGNLGSFATGAGQAPKVRGAIAGVVGPYVEIIGLDKNKRASISGDGFGSFGDDDGAPLDGEVAGAIAGDTLFVLGGDAKPQNVYATRMSQTGVSPMSDAGSLVVPRKAAGAVVVGDWLYVLGGYDAGGTQVLTGIERARLQ